MGLGLVTGLERAESSLVARRQIPGIAIECIAEMSAADVGVSSADRPTWFAELTVRRPLSQSCLWQMVQDAQRGKFDVVMAEALDGISRDQADVATLFKHLRFAGIPIVTLAEGEISELHVGLKGTMNALALKDLTDKTRRGLRGRVEKGKAGGGLCYGYSVLKTFDAGGERIRGDREIDESQAEIVRRIFREFASGKSPKAIAVDLNRLAVEGPLGRAWGDTSIRGHVSRGTGIINNELYVGVLVWNRQRFIKNPRNGKRVSRMNPENQWIRKEVPHLRVPVSSRMPINSPRSAA
ncbi:recombinase family protein [Mesorhizobium australicum]|uniref:recombinase family protein n=1 Tax=Mesorhizobium australicum TaxID=536018 RepID=UPI00333B5B9C